MKLVESTEEGGLVSLLGESVMIFCVNYIYAGTLSGVNSTCIQLKDPKIVYETGSFSDKGYKDAQSLPTSLWYIQISSIESFGLGK
jgi:hypothetical protein